MRSTSSTKSAAPKLSSQMSFSSSQLVPLPHTKITSGVEPVESRVACVMVHPCTLPKTRTLPGTFQSLGGGSERGCTSLIDGRADRVARELWEVCDVELRARARQRRHDLVPVNMQASRWKGDGRERRAARVEERARARNEHRHRLRLVAVPCALRIPRDGDAREHRPVRDGSCSLPTAAPIPRQVTGLSGQTHPRREEEEGGRPERWPAGFRAPRGCHGVQAASQKHRTCLGAHRRSASTPAGDSGEVRIAHSTQGCRAR